MVKLYISVINLPTLYWLLFSVALGRLVALEKSFALERSFALGR